MSRSRNAPPQLALDFAPRPQRPSVVGWVVLAVGVAASAWAGVEMVFQQRSTAVLDAAVQQQRAQLRDTRPAAARDAMPAYALEPAAKVAAELNARWDRVFGELANVRIDGVALQEIVADAGRGTLRVIGHAGTLDQAFDYIELLHRAGVLRDVAIDSHEWAAAGGRDVVRFTMSARWGAPR